MKNIFILLMIMLPPFSSLADATTPPVSPADDNGDASFVRQIMPKLLGRKPKGTQEVTLLADLAALHGRETVVRMLMEQSDFTTHWTALIADHMEMYRSEGKRNQSFECFGEPVSLGLAEFASVSTPIAKFVRDNDFQSPYTRKFNMFELVKSAIEIDNLFPAYRGYLFALASKVGDGNTMISDEEQREQTGIHFDQVFLGRNLGCMTCHNSARAVTESKGQHHPLYSSLDFAMYDHTGLGLNIPDIDEKEYPAYKDFGCQSCHGFNGDGGSSNHSIVGATKQQIISALQNPQGSMAFSAGTWKNIKEYEVDEIVEALKDPGPFSFDRISSTAAKHYAVFRRDFFSTDDPELGYGPWGMTTDCASISGQSNEGAIAAFFAGIEGNYKAIHHVDQALVNGYTDLTSAVPITGETGFAHMLATKITENVWKQFMGEPLTLSNYFARNAKQKNLHQYLTEDIFIWNDWSLKELIVAVVKMRFFNRQAPVSSVASNAAVLPPIFEPFAPKTQACSSSTQHRGDDNPTTGFNPSNDFTLLVNDERRFHLNDTLHPNELCSYNVQGDLVHRYAPRTLLNSIGAALDWPKPTLFGKQYPKLKFQESIGQYIVNLAPGTESVDFQTLLSWDGTYGLCSKSGKNVDTDWIDKMHGAIDGYNTRHPKTPLTLGDVVKTLKDWLIQEPVFGGYQRETSRLTHSSTLAQGIVDPIITESMLVEALFKDTPLNTVVSTASVHQETLRELCGVYLKSPQFMLAGLVRNGDFEPPRFRVCNDAVCSYKSMCEAYKPALKQIGAPTQCNSSSVNVPPGKLPLQVKTSTGATLPIRGLQTYTARKVYGERLLE